MTLGIATRQITAIVKNAGHFDYAVVAAAIEKKMARLVTLAPLTPTMIKACRMSVL